MELLSELAGYEVTYVELGGVVFGLAYVLLSIRQNVWCWPVGLVSVACFLALFAQARLYADAGLQAFYIGLSLYGWYYWLRGGDRGTEAPVARMPARAGGVLAALVVLATAGLGYGLATYTDADLPYWDAFTTATSLAAQWLLAKKMLENWLVWIGVDALYVAIYVYKDLYFTAGLFALYTVLAVAGWRAWRRSMQAEHDAPLNVPAEAAS